MIFATVEALPTPWRSALPFPWQVCECCECLLPANVGHSVLWTRQVLYLQVTKYAWSQYHQLVLLVLIADLPLHISWWVYSCVRLKTMRAKKEHSHLDRLACFTVLSGGMKSWIGHWPCLNCVRKKKLCPTHRSCDRMQKTCPGSSETNLLQGEGRWAWSQP